MLKNVAFVLAVIAASSLFVGASVANAARYAVDLTAEHLAAYGASTDESAEYYTLGLPIPEVIRGKELYGAYVELYVDVESVEKDGPVVDTPVLEVFALKSAFAGQVDEQQLGAPAFGPRNVARGEDRRVIFDVTDIVRTYLEDPASNHGLIFGSLTGIRSGRFTVKSGVLGRDAIARIIFHFRDR
jgi:hypothetical protein